MQCDRASSAAQPQVPAELGRQVMLSLWQQQKMVNTLCCSAAPGLMVFLVFSVTFTNINQFELVQASSSLFICSTKSLLDWPKSESDLFQPQQYLDANCTNHVMIWLLACDCGYPSVGETWPDQGTRSWIHTQVADKSSTMILLKSVKASSGNVCGSQSHSIDYSWMCSQHFQRSLKQ